MSLLEPPFSDKDLAPIPDYLMMRLCAGQCVYPSRICRAVAMYLCTIATAKDREFPYVGFAMVIVKNIQRLQTVMPRSLTTTEVINAIQQLEEDGVLTKRPTDNAKTVFVDINLTPYALRFDGDFAENLLAYPPVRPGVDEDMYPIGFLGVYRYC